MSKCCICGCEINSIYGENNPRGAMWKDEDGNIVDPTFGPEDVCCNDCNNRYVIPGRIYRMTHKNENK